MRIAVILPRFPYPLEKGDKLRAYHQIKALAAEVEVNLIALSHESVSEASKAELSNYCKSMKILSISKLRLLINLILGVFRSMPLQVSYFYSRSKKKAIDNILDDLNVDVIYTQLTRTMLYTQHRPEKKVIDLMDAFSYGMAKRSINASWLWKRIYRRESNLLKAMEEQYIKAFDAITIISDQDKLRVPHLNTTDITVVRNGVDVDAYNKAHITPTYDLVFVGNMGYTPNIDAALYIVNRVIPAYRDKFGQTLTLNIVGARPSKLVLELESDYVNVTGWVEDIVAEYQSGKLFLAPIFHGIGQQNKVMEAMLCEVPCLVSSEVAAPFNSLGDTKLLVADTVDEYVDTIYQVLNDKIEIPLLVNTAKQAICQNYNWETQTTPLIQIMQNLV